MLDMKLHKRLKDINTKLIVIEKQIVKTAKRLDQSLQKELAESIDGMVDYELDAIVSFFKKNSDGDPFCEVSQGFKGVSLEDKKYRYFFDDKRNHNEFTFWQTHPMKGEFHCWLFHSLYDHIDLSWEEIVSIDTVWIDIRPRYQYCIDFNF